MAKRKYSIDTPDEKGEKSFERNLKAASRWSKTYAEFSKSGKGIHPHYIYDVEVFPNLIVRMYKGERKKEV